MNYIVMDMEWNQPWPGSPSSKKVLPVQIRGEIIQIGAVRVTEDRQVADEFQVLIKPKYYRHLNRRVSKLTGIKDAQLRDEGVPFPEAVRQFKKWCGESDSNRHLLILLLSALPLSYLSFIIALVIFANRFLSKTKSVQNPNICSASEHYNVFIS